MRNLFILLLGTILLLACSPETSEENATPLGDWRHHGGNHRSEKYSPLDQVNGSNFGLLEVAWRCLLYTSPSPRDRG